ncbi:MAG: ArsR family transcriptional regulator [Promethearchaeota archaeon]
MWTEVGYVLASKYREIIIKKLSKKNYLPSMLAKETNFQLAHISRALRELKDKNLVKCLNENSKKGKIYALTEYGKEVAKLIKANL